MNQQNSDLLQFLGFEYYQEIEEYIKAVHLPYGSNQLLEQPVSLIEICLLIYFFIQKKYLFNHEENKDDRLLIKHDFHKHEDMELLKDTYLGLYNLIIKSADCGFIIILNSENNFFEFMSKLKSNTQ